VIIFYGLLCGAALGLTGGGGSILAVPMLVYWVGLSFHQAVAVSLLVVGTTALAGFLPKIKTAEVEISAGLILAIAGMVFAPFGSFASSFISGRTLTVAFSAFMLVIGAWTWARSKMPALNQPNKEAACGYLPSGKLHLTKKCNFVLLLSGVVTGFLTGMFGVGGGFLIVPALVIAAKMPIKKAITTSLLIISLISMSGFVSHIQHVNVTWKIAAYFIIGALIGMFGALKIKDRMNGLVLQRVFSVLLVIFGLIMLVIQLA
jgi:uncharacterized protein